MDVSPFEYFFEKHNDLELYSLFVIKTGKMWIPPQKTMTVILVRCANLKKINNPSKHMENFKYKKTPIRLYF